MRIILASQSPRRRELLERMGIFAFEVIPARGEEVVHPGLAPARLVEELLLSQEADSAQEDRMSMARKAGEEAGTKLLLPMMLMMVVAMILVLLPAYINFGSI